MDFCQYPEGYLAAKGKGDVEKNGTYVSDQEDEEVESRKTRKSNGKKKRKFLGMSRVNSLIVLYSAL